MDIASIAILLLATIGPTRAAIVFVGMTKSADAELKRKIALRTVLVSAIVCCIFVVLGSVILGALKISIPALLIAGGLILFAFALPMVIGEDKQKESDSPSPPPSIEIATYPLAVPLMASPQGLVAIVSIEATLPGISGTALLLGLVLGIMLVNLLFLLAAEKMLSKVPPAALKVALRIIGLLLCSLAVQLVIIGLQKLGVIAEQLT